MGHANMHEHLKYICYVSSHKKYFLNNSYTNDTNKLFKITLVTITYNLYRLLRYIYLCILTKMFDMFILIVQP